MQSPREFPVVNLQNKKSIMKVPPKVIPPQTMPGLEHNNSFTVIINED